VGPAGYQQAIDMLVQYFTSRGVAVILDNHASCAGGSLDCKNSGPMALRNFGNLTGAGAFWSLVSQRYAANPLVLLELYNEPHLWFQGWFGGDPTYIGMYEMYSIVRAAAPSNLVLIAGMASYAQDAAGLTAFWLEYMRLQNGSTPTNVMAVLHPYQGMYQGLSISLRSTLRLVLAAKQMMPVIFTELGQYCCNAGPQVSCQGPIACKDPLHSDNFVHNLLNLAVEHDISFTIWAWDGTQPGTGNCTTGQPQCAYPSIRANGPGGVGVLTNGSLGGANVSDVWARYVASPAITVQDVAVPANGSEANYEPAGFLPRPCIAGETGYGMGRYCGWPLGTNWTVIGRGWNGLWNQTPAESVLPGLPPQVPSVCTLQACPGWQCSPTSPIIPMPQPCVAEGV